MHVSPALIRLEILKEPVIHPHQKIDCVSLKTRCGRTSDKVTQKNHLIDMKRTRRMPLSIAIVNGHYPNGIDVVPGFLLCLPHSCFAWGLSRIYPSTWQCPTIASFFYQQYFVF